jgi:uncharacterized radical SAM superfamily protein
MRMGGERFVREQEGLPRTVEALLAVPWESLRAAAWAVRRAHHPDRLTFAVPGAKRYETEYYASDPRRFASISLTGTACALQCDHCRGRLLAGMHPASTPEALLSLAKDLIDDGCEGVLLSGGAGADGAVPVKPFLEAMARLREWGLRVIVHTGLLDRATARGLKQAGVDQVLFDVIGDEGTIRRVLHLDRTPADYAATLRLLREEGVPVAPHVVIGLHYGQLRGELRALDMVRGAGADVIVLVVLRPLRRTPMEGMQSVSADAVGRLAAVARTANPRTPLTLGCARPAGEAKVAMERRAVQAGVNVVAYPDPATVRLAGALGLRTAFVERCCTLCIPG